MNDDKNDSLQDYFVYIIIFMAFIFFYMYYLQPKIDEAWLVMVLYESKFITLYATGDLLFRAQDVVAWAEKTASSEVTQSAKSMIESNVLQMAWHRWFLYCGLLISSYFIYKKRSAYSGLPSIQTLLKTEHKVWPTLEFVKRFDPIVSFKELSGIGRYTMSPAVFAAETKIIPNMASTAGGSKYDRLFDKARAYKVFTTQLGPRFKNYADLPAFHKAIITLTVAKDLPFHFKEYDDLLRFFSKEFADTNQTSKELESFLDKICQPLMDALDGSTYYGRSNLVETSNTLVSKYITKAETLPKTDRKAFLLKHGIEKKYWKYKILSNHKIMMGSDYKRSVSLSKIKHPLIRRIVDSLLNQHIDDKSNKTLIRETTFDVFHGFLGKRAFISTLILDACRMAKRNGKFPPGRLVFFRPWDRLLSSLIGGALKYDDKENRAIVTKSNVCEINGAMAHYFIEELAGRKIVDPQVEAAVEGLRSLLIQQNVIVNKD
jgi:hypothetical protein